MTSLLDEAPCALEGYEARKPATPHPSPMPPWTRAWLAEAYARCDGQLRCANEFGVAWRYQVPEFKRHEKCLGACLCRRYANAPLIIGNGG